MSKAEKMELAKLENKEKLTKSERHRLNYLLNVRDEAMAPKNP